MRTLFSHVGVDDWWVGPESRKMETEFLWIITKIGEVFGMFVGLDTKQMNMEYTRSGYLDILQS